MSKREAARRLRVLAYALQGAEEAEDPNFQIWIEDLFEIAEGLDPEER